MKRAIAGTIAIAALALSLPAISLSADTARLKDIGRLDGWRENPLVGVGVVTGLAGTGDSPRSQATRQSIANLLATFDVVIPSDQINSRNVALVSVLASLPPVARAGDRVDVVVTSLGDARSLLGGTLMLAPLKAANRKIYALAQGAISVGGYRYDQNGNVAQKNHPTAGIIPGGAQVEEEIPGSPVRPEGFVDFVLTTPDFTTAERVADAINAHYRSSLATVRDSGAVRIQVPKRETVDPMTFVAAVENIEVAPDRRARVIVNERTGSIVSGGDVRISKVTIAHGSIRVSIITDFLVSQPLLVSRPGANIRTEVVPSTRINVDEASGGVVEIGGRSSVADLVTALTRIKASTRDIIAILQGIKAAGALHAELIIQ
jgi:flagellar P-ring protein FlgI